MTEETPEFVEKLIGVLKSIVDRLDTQAVDIENIKAREDELEHQLDIIFENQIGHQAICGDS